jgi:hypothetical protein
MCRYGGDIGCYEKYGVHCEKISTCSRQAVTDDTRELVQMAREPVLTLTNLERLLKMRTMTIIDSTQDEESTELRGYGGSS